MRKNYSFFKSITKFSYYLSDKIVKIVKKLYTFFIFVLIFFTMEMILLNVLDQTFILSR